MTEPSSAVRSSLLLEPRSLLGRQLGDFVLERLIGSGGMGDVYLAQQVSLPRHVALKLLRPDLARDEQYLRRFRAEANAVAPLNHPNIVSVYSIGEQDGLHFIAFEFVRGINLRQYIDRQGPLPEEACLRIASRVAAALVQADEQGIIHRDIKPENVLITRRGEVKVADFGLARQAGVEDVRLTQTGVTLGTPLYMSPEQIQGHALDSRSDIYSLGVMCYHMLAGEPPFRAETAMAVAIQHVHGTPEPLLDMRPDVREEFLAVVSRMMAKRPDDRYPSPQQLLTDLERLQAGEAHLIKPWPGWEATLRDKRAKSGMFRQLNRRLREATSTAMTPPFLGWTVAGSLVLALVAGLAVAKWTRRIPDRPRTIPYVADIPQQASGFMQFNYASTVNDQDTAERALWAVLLMHRGDEKYTIQAAQELADKYLANERYASLDLLARYLLEREGLMQQTYGYLIAGLSQSGQQEPKDAEKSFAKMLELASRGEWGGEPLDWLARKYFLAKRIGDAAMRVSPEESELAKERFWKAFTPPPPQQAGMAFPPPPPG